MKKLTQGMDEQNKRMASASDEVKDKIVSKFIAYSLLQCNIIATSDH